jgi:transcriptional repressor NrdR
MVIACGKRPVPLETLREAACDIERDLFQEFEEEVPSAGVGERVMRGLAVIDTVAYVRFASVYQKFENLGDFMRIVEGVAR